MANWWEAAPLAPQQAQSPANWWEAAPLAQPQTNAIEQGASGLNEGIAQMLGLPGMGMSALVNMGLAAESGNDPAGPVQMPEVGGPQFYEGVGRDLGLISEADPQTAGQRLARRVGQDVGAGAVAAPVAGISSLGGLALNAAADVGSGLAGGLTSEMTDNPIANVVASILGGGGVVAGARAARPGPQAPSMEDLRRTQKSAYDAVENSPAQLTPQATQDLVSAVERRMAAENIDPYLHPKATRTTERLGEMTDPTIYQVEQRRRLVGRDVAGAQDASERALGQAMKDEIDAFLDNLQPSQVRGQNVQDVVDALHTGRGTTRKIKNAEAIESAIYRGENRAATSGTGGNEVNAIRQNIRAILDDPKKRRGYSAEEIAQMEGIVRGTAATNAARMIGRLSPTSGALPMMGGGGLSGAAFATGNPLYMAPPIIGWVAKATGEKLTQRQVNNLSEIIRNGGAVAPKALSDAERRVLNALMAVQAGNSAQDQ